MRTFPSVLSSSLACLLALAGPATGTHAAEAEIPLDRLLLEAAPIPAEGQTTSWSPPAAYFTMPNGTAAPQWTDLPPSPLPLPDLDTDPEDTAAYLAAIDTAELEAGPFAEELLPQFFALGLSHQRQGDHEEALDALGKAEYLSRINHGLQAREQVGIVEYMIRSHEALGEIGEVQQKQQYLLYLMENSYGERNRFMAPLLNRLADQNLDAFHRQLLRKPGFTVSFGGPGPGGNMSPRVLAFGNLYLAQGRYYQAILNLLDNRDYFNPQLAALEMKLLETIYLAANRRGLIDNPVFFLNHRGQRTGSRIGRNEAEGSAISFLNGKNTWARLRMYENAKARPEPLAVADTMLGLADWHMLFDRRKVALRMYQEAHDYLLESGVPQNRVAALLSPAVPLQLPGFAPLPFSRARHGIAADKALPHQGWVDLEFRISRWGQARDVDILASSDNANRTIERQIRRLVHGAPFRPRFVDGAPSRDDRVQLRYYFLDTASL